MADTPAPSPAPRPSRRTPPRAATPPGPAAGYPIGPVARGTAPATAPDLPPGIPPHMAGAIVTPRTVRPAASAAPAAQARPLHPTFAPADAVRRALRQQAETLRTSAQAAAVSTRAHVAALKGLLTEVKKTPEGIAAAEAEGLDLAHLCTFLESLQIAESLTVGAEPESSPDPAPQDKA